MDFWFWILKRGVQARKNLPKEMFIDVSYERYTHNPVATVEGIYNFFNISFDSSLRTRIEHFMNSSERDLSVSRHPLKDFDIDENIIRKKYEDAMRGLDLNFI